MESVSYFRLLSRVDVLLSVFKHIKTSLKTRPPANQMPREYFLNTVDVLAQKHFTFPSLVFLTVRSTSVRIITSYIYH